MTDQETTEKEAPAEKPPGLLREHPAFRRFWISRAVSELGSAVTTVALPVLTYQQTHSAVLVSLVSAAATLPYVAFGLLAGALADRVDRRRLMVATDWLNALVLATIPLAHATHTLTTAHLLLAALTSASLTLFYEAAVYGLVPDIVGKHALARANSALYGVETLMRITGTAAAGTLIATLRPATTLAGDALSFAASALLVRAITRPAPHPAPPPRPSLRRSVTEGLRFLWHHRTLRLLTAVGTLQSFAGGAVIGQLVVFADRGLGLHDSDPRIGLLYTAWSAGGIGGSLLLPRLLRRFDAFRILLGVLPAGAALGVLVVLTRDWRPALPAITAWGCAYLVVLVNTMTYSQEVTPPHLQSRVNTTRRMLSSGLGVPLGALVASTVTVRAGIRAGMACAVVSLTLAALLVWTVRLRAAHLPTPPPP
ncbi:MFS transporter [Streptomyces rubellomurinus]|uniref:MFS transporter n=1 Tax=Streptomyces rubellomurinus (strain ATCC 31215) TaxID=359131 RepID=UPI0005F1E8AB|nr:MFS transporter [Streptomyces rubellomurinus]